MEVLVSIILISGVILTLFEINSNNLFFLEKFSQNSDSNSALSLTMLSHKEIANENKNVYIKDIIEFKNNEVSKIFKDIKIKIKDNVFEKQEITLDKNTVNVEVYETELTLNDRKKKFYTMKLN